MIYVRRSAEFWVLASYGCYQLWQPVPPHTETCALGNARPPHIECVPSNRGDTHRGLVPG